MDPTRERLPMSATNPAASPARLPELVAAIETRVRAAVADADQALASAFARRYYDGVSPEDLLGEDAAHLAAAAVRQLEFARTRRAGQTLVRAYVPPGDAHARTVVEIVTDDMPFLVDSVSMELNRQGAAIQLTIHPVIAVCRDGEGRMTGIPPDTGQCSGTVVESFLHLAIDHGPAPLAPERLAQDVRDRLGDVRAAVEDWAAMRERVERVLAELVGKPPPLPAEDLAEATAFLAWLRDDHFTFLGYREYRLAREDGNDVLRVAPGSGLGILRSVDEQATSRSFARLSPGARARARDPDLLVITKGNSRSTVHRPAYLDYVGVKVFDDDGRVVGERRFLGLYTSVAYHSDPRTIPLLRRKVQAVLARSGLNPVSHAGKALLNILQTHPRDELFQSDDGELYEAAMGILHLQERQRVRLFVRRDGFGRYYSCIVFVPRDRYDTGLARRIEHILVQALNGRNVEFAATVSESMLARMHFVVFTETGAVEPPDVAALERLIVAAARSWHDGLRAALAGARTEADAATLFERYRIAFDAAYTEVNGPETALADIGVLESLAADGTPSVGLAVRGDEGLALRVFRAGQPVALSDVLPMLENLGLRVIGERLHRVTPSGREPAWIHEFSMTRARGPVPGIDGLQERFAGVFLRVFRGEVDNDGFNALALEAGLDWRHIVLLRACCKYLIQTQLPFSQAYMERALAGNGAIARRLVEYFTSRFEPGRDEGRVQRMDALASAIKADLDAVASLDEDRILRALFSVLRATTRTNFWRRDEQGRLRPFVSIKLDPAAIPVLPEPRPRFEIFVYSARMEGVHLRGGKVARGGIRWSDRREDYRNEVLGLMKAQMVKNALIVPVGAKGGFVVKTGGAEPPATLVTDCYRDFMRGLLDLTDNRRGDAIVPPPDTVRFDEDDPYLVVAADKGTSTFSDIANAVAREYAFWLHDAFASGGSSGYDHKELGITARGAWESVLRHFRELGVDARDAPLTLVGIGDMSGDVFGNGLLLQPNLRLVAAFNHRHIFVDPDPDPGLALAERRRLFAMPRSQWSDYDPRALSSGGGVFERSAKAVRLAPQVRARLGIAAEVLTPNELVSAILRAPVDLLWSAGIGTFVKARAETHADARDRANDAVRVNAPELRCRVVGEGGNLGFTQLARVEYARLGGCINTDFVDNSGGVNCSDREVNIKILLNEQVVRGELDLAGRDRLLSSMAGEVTGLVLSDNHAHAQSLSLASDRGGEGLSAQADLLRALEHGGALHRARECLPDEDEIARRLAAGEGFTRPELAVLSAYSRLALFESLVESDVPDDPFFLAELGSYFPAPLRAVAAADMAAHRLRREIIATRLANSLTNAVNITFVQRVSQDTGWSPADVARCYAVARDVFDVDDLHAHVRAHDDRVHGQVQVGMLREIARLTERATLWLLRNRRQPLNAADTVAFFRPGVIELGEALASLTVPEHRRHLRRAARSWVESGVDAPTAERVAGLGAWYSALDMVEIAHDTGRRLALTARVYFEIGSRLELFWLREQSAALPVRHRWQERGKTVLHDDLYRHQARLTREVMRLYGRRRSSPSLVAEWMSRNAAPLARLARTLEELRAVPHLDFAMLAVAAREVRNLLERER